MRDGLRQYRDTTLCASCAHPHANHSATGCFDGCACSRAAFKPVRAVYAPPPVEPEIARRRAPDHGVVHAAVCSCEHTRLHHFRGGKCRSCACGWFTPKAAPRAEAR